MWIEIAPTLPAEFTTLNNTASAGIGLVRSALEALRLSLQATTQDIASNETALVGRVNDAVRGLITAINSALTNLLDSAGLYFLLVPIPKKGLARLAVGAYEEGWTGGSQTTSSQGSNYIDFPMRSVIDQADEATQNRLRASRTFEQLFSANDLFVGGNTHFIKTVAEALFDPNDVNRPRFENGSYWGYTAFIAGASDLSAIIQSASFFERLFNNNPNANEIGASRGVQNLVPTGVVATPGHRGAPVITWDLVPASRVLTSYDSTRIVATKYAIIRSTGSQARTAERVTELFGSRDLRVGLEGAHGSRVLAVRDYDGVITRFVDDSPLDDSKTYYYHVAFATRVVPTLPETENDPTTSNVTQVPTAETYNIGFDYLSSACVYQKPRRARDYGAAALGTAPDWRRTPSAVTLIPALDRYVGLIQEYLRSLQSAANNITAQNQSVVDLLTRQIDRYARFSADFERRLQSISSVFQAPVAGTYATYREGSGPVSAFLSDLVQVFEDPNDENRPPFDNGDEFTTGAIILAVGPDPAPISAAFSLLRAIFTTQNTIDPALEGINSVNGELDQLEAQLIGQLAPSTIPPVTFNADLTPRPVGSGDASCD